MILLKRLFVSVNNDTKLRYIIEKYIIFAEYLGKYMKKVGFSLLLSLVVVLATAQESQTEYNFLRLPVSSHAAALGGGNISLVDDDASLIYQNPALLSSVSDKSLFFGYMRYMHDTNMGAAAFSRTLTDRASWAVAGQYVDYGTMKQTDEAGVATGRFKAKDIALSGCFSYLLTDRLAGGIAARFITSTLGEYHAVAVGVDLGLNYYVPDDEFSLSLVARNLGGQLKAFADDYEPMPIDIQLGVSKRFSHTPFGVHLTMVDLNHWDYKLLHHCQAGIDAQLSSAVWIGVGYRFRQGHDMRISAGEEEVVTGGAGFTAGAGLNLERFKLNLAYGRYHVSSHSLLLNVGFSL